MISRRTFLTTTAAAAAAIAAPSLVRLTRKAPRAIAGGFVDDGGVLGHRVRDGVIERASGGEARRVPVVIVGSGIAGLSAAWWLERNGMRDFVVLEMERTAGGNSRWGESEITAFPWAAHYVPVPGPGATLARELFGELGVLRADGTWDERHLVHAPQERLWRHGEWHPSVRPDYALSPAERDQFARFDGRVAELRASGEFTIPLATGLDHPSRATRHAPLDGMTMSDWLAREGFTSPALRWYTDYACRDDYGAPLDATSAWAGLHYFAARPAEEEGPLTWAEGNGWIVRRLLERFGDRVETSSAVLRVERRGAGWRVRTRAGDVDADSVVWAAPSVLAPYVVEGWPHDGRPVEYSPWLTANLVLDRMPAERAGASPAWDNVIYGSPSLGYVVADHQSLAQPDGRSVWTYYWALTGLSPAAAREELRTRPWSHWVERILADLQRVHPDVRGCVSRIDVLRLAHAMPRPVPGFLQHVRAGAPELPGLFAAHSDLSGLSLFEEAQYRGVEAAGRVLQRA